MLETVMIIAGESSGELYGALLARTLRARHPSARITGVGGHRMEAAGVELLSRIAGAFGAVEVMKSIGELEDLRSVPRTVPFSYATPTLACLHMRASA